MTPSSIWRINAKIKLDNSVTEAWRRDGLVWIWRWGDEKYSRERWLRLTGCCGMNRSWLGGDVGKDIPGRETVWAKVERSKNPWGRKSIEWLPWTSQKWVWDKFMKGVYTMLRIFGFCSLIGGKPLTNFKQKFKTMGFVIFLQRLFWWLYWGWLERRGWGPGDWVAATIYPPWKLLAEEWGELGRRRRLDPWDLELWNQ